MAQRWYVAKTLHKQEHWAVKNLKLMGFEAYWPRFVKEKMRRGMLMDVCSPMFPGYLFVSFDIFEDPWRRINSAYGIRELMMSGDYVPAVPEGFVEGLQEAAQDGLLREEEKFVGVCVGEMAKVLSGPLEGRMGRCEFSADDRVVLLLSLLSRETRVSFPCSQVVAASHDTM